jgi:hypothetical protein
VTDLVSVKVHSFFLEIQHEQGCWRSHLHLARAQGAQDFRLDLGDLILLFPDMKVSTDRGLGKWFNIRFATYSQVLCEEISPGELEMTSLVELVSTGERVRMLARSAHFALVLSGVGIWIGYGRLASRYARTIRGLRVNRCLLR